MIGIIGVGNMGRAIALRAGTKVFVSDEDKDKLDFKGNNSLIPLKDNIELVKRSDIIIIAVKPQCIKGVLNEIAPFSNGKLIISIAAGIETRFIEDILDKAKVVRVMPNMPLIAGKAVSAVCKGRSAMSENLNTVIEIFSNFGETVEVKETLMDAVTAVSGSGPAYYFLFTDLLEKAGISCGLDKALAGRLAIAAFIGAAECAKDAEVSMHDFVQKVTSKGGTTEAALKVFKKKGMDKIVKQAVEAARDRSKQLRKLLSLSS